MIIPPNVIYLPNGHLQCPFWPELEYLKNICEEAPKDIVGEIIQIVLDLPAVDNPRIYEYILDMALVLDGKRSAKLKPKMLEYARLKHQFFPFQYPKLLGHWTAEGQTDGALELANILFQFTPDPEAEQKKRQYNEINKNRTDSDKDQLALMMTILRPMPRFNENYREILNEGVLPLAEKEPYRVARILIDATSNMIRLGKHEDEIERDGNSDYSKYGARVSIIQLRTNRNLESP